MPATQVFRPLRRWFDRLWPSRPRLVIESDLWERTVKELGRRGLHGQREAGAFLLSSRRAGDRRVAKAVYFDDLDPDCLVGNIHFRSPGYSKLWDICDKEDLRVVADVHTHPGTGVSQSTTDRGNPMVARIGHLALIVPCYGMRPVAANEVGVHEYHGDRGWESWLGPRAKRVLLIKGS